MLVCYLCSFWLLIFSQFTLTAVSVELPICIILGDNSSSLLLSPIRIKPAVDIALAQISRLVKDQSYANFTLRCTYSYDGCSEPIRGDVAVAVEAYIRGDAWAFFGPPCNDALVAVADLSASWNLPVISLSSDSSVLDDKARFPTLTRMSYEITALYEFVAALFEEYKWKTCMILYDDNYIGFAKGLEHTIHISGVDAHEHLVEAGEIEEALKEAEFVSRSKVTSMRFAC